MLNQSGYLDVNGRPQFLSLRAQREGLPLLLYLHGGPGDAALPLVRRYNRALEGRYTVAVWEQRGAGKSYYPFSPGEPLTIQTFVDDLHCIVTHLLRRFHQEKLYLLGHSWGSVLGLQYLRQHPELIHTYVGCGQVVNMREGALQSIRRLWPELMGVDFTPVTSFGAPVVFLEGRHDRHVPSELLAAYYESLTSPKRLHWFERSCHFPQWSEADKFNTLLCAPD